MRNDNFFNNLIKFGIGPIGAAIISFITIPITTWLVDPEQFGLTTMFTLFQTLITSFIFLGIDQAYVREYNDYKQKKNELIIECYFFTVIFSIITMTITFSFLR